MTFSKPIKVRCGAREWHVAHRAQDVASLSVVPRALAVPLAQAWCRDDDFVRDTLPRLYADLNGITSPSALPDAARLGAWFCRAFETAEFVILDAPRPPVRVAPASPSPPPPPPPPPPAPQKKAAPAPEPEGPSLPDPSVDQDDQAQALRDAAQAGVPFCEECEKARQAQAAQASQPQTNAP